MEAGAPAGGGNAPSVSDLDLENEFYKVVLREKDGTVASLMDKELKREFVDPRAEHGFNGLVYRLQERLTEREYKQLGEIPMQDVGIAKGASGPVYSSLKISGHIEYMCKFEHEIILYSGLKRVDFINRMMKKPVYPKETVHYAFPFAIPTDYHFWRDSWSHQNTYKIDVPGGVMPAGPGPDSHSFATITWRGTGSPSRARITARCGRPSMRRWCSSAEFRRTSICPG